MVKEINEKDLRYGLLVTKGPADAKMGKNLLKFIKERYTDIDADESNVYTMELIVGYILQVIITQLKEYPDMRDIQMAVYFNSSKSITISFKGISDHISPEKLIINKCRNWNVQVSITRMDKEFKVNIDIP